MKPGETKLLAFVERHMAEHGGGSPSFEEMRIGVGLASKSGVARLVEALEAAGRIRRTGAKRTIEIVGLPALLITTSDEELLAEVARRGLDRTPA